MEREYVRKLQWGLDRYRSFLRELYDKEQLPGGKVSYCRCGLLGPWMEVASATSKQMVVYKACK